MTNPLSCQGDPNDPTSVGLFPSGSQPTRSPGTVADLCSEGLSQMVVTGCLTVTLQGHFARAENLIFPAMRKRFANIATTPNMLFIDSLHRWYGQKDNAMPALVVREGDWTARPTQTFDNDHGIDFQTGVRYFSCIYDCTHVVFAMAIEGGEALALAEETHRYLMYTSGDFGRSVGVEQYRVGSIGQVHYVSTEPLTYAVPIPLSYVVKQTWSIHPNAPLLKQVVFKLSQILPTG